MKTHNYFTKLQVVHRGVQQLHNGESADAGVDSTLVNMRECEMALEVVGNPKQLRQLMPGDKVLLVDGDRTLLMRGGKVVWNDVVLLDTQATVIAAHKVGALVVVVTSQGNVVMRRTLLGYDVVDVAQALPQVHLAAVETATVSTTIQAMDFAAPYSSWQAPLASADVESLARLMRNALATMQSNAMEQGRFTGLMMARYGVRLWDDSYLWLSQPVLLGRNTLSTNYRSIATVTTSGNQFTGIGSFDFSLASYRLGITMATGISTEWRELVKAIDVMVTPVELPFATASLDYRCTMSTSSGTRRYQLELGPKPRSASAMMPALLSADWQVVASTSRLDGSAFTGANVAMSSQQVVPGLRCDVVMAQLPAVSRLTNGECEQVMRHASLNAVAAVSMEHNGRLYQAPAAFAITNPWQVLPWLDGTLNGGTVDATVQVTLSTSDGNVLLTTSGSCPCGAVELNPIVAFPDARATHIVIAVGNKRWEANLAPVEGTGMAVFVSPSLLTNAMTPGPHPSGGSGKALMPAGGTVVVSAVGNPLVVQWRAAVSGCDILAMGAACRPIYSGGFGRYPIYIFTTQGIMALPQSTAGNYGEPRLITQAVIARESRPVQGGDGLWFVDQHGILCQLVGSLLKRVLHGVDTAAAMAWCDRYRELWLTSAQGATVVMESGRTFVRDIDVATLYSDPMHALAVTGTGMLLDLANEEPGEIFFSFLSHPFVISPLMLRRRAIVVWNLFNSAPWLPQASARVELSILGERGSSCHGFLISKVTATGTIAAPLSRPVVLPPTRTLRLAATGTLPTGAQLLPTQLLAMQ